MALIICITEETQYDVQEPFTKIEGDPSDVIDIPNEIQEYKITID